MLKGLEKAGLTLNSSKCIFATNIIFHLVHIIDKNGIRPDPAKIRSLVYFKVNLSTQRQHQVAESIPWSRFLLTVHPGIRVVISHIERPIEQEYRIGVGRRSRGRAKEELVRRLVSPPVLAHFD